jgi:hypothetical protein
MAKKNPLAIVKERFTDKTKLVEAVQAFITDELWLPRTRADRIDGSKGLEHVSNAKLLRLYDTFSLVKSKFGTRDKLIEAILELEKRSKDAGMRARLGAYPIPRLYDAYKSASKRAKVAG